MIFEYGNIAYCFCCGRPIGMIIFESPISLIIPDQLPSIEVLCQFCKDEHERKNLSPELQKKNSFQQSKQVFDDELLDLKFKQLIKDSKIS